MGILVSGESILYLEHLASLRTLETGHLWKLGYIPFLPLVNCKQVQLNHEEISEFVMNSTLFSQNVQVV